MSDDVAYTRSLLRRFFAYVIDAVVAGIFTGLAIMLLGGATGDQFRVSNGFLTFKVCEPGQNILGPDGVPLSTSGFNSIQVCTTTSDFVLKDRTATFAKESSGADSTDTTTYSWSYNEGVTFPVDDQNRAVRPIYLDLAFWLVLILGAAAFEASRLQATPGKLLLGLGVRAESGEHPTGKAALIRNALKNSWALYGVFQFYLQLKLLDYETLFQNGKVVIPPDLSEQVQVSFLVGLAITVFMIAIVFGLFFPWRKAGRALYDRIAGTYVIRTG